VIVHLKDVAWQIESDNTLAWRTVPLGQGGIPLKRFADNALEIIPTHYLTFEISTSGGLRKSIISNNNTDFFRIYQKYESSFDDYCERGKSSCLELLQQEKDHINQSCLWLTKYGYLPQNTNEIIL
jgi:molecular chaperone DnaK (HSP70)